MKVGRILWDGSTNLNELTTPQLHAALVRARGLEDRQLEVTVLAEMKLRAADAASSAATPDEEEEVFFTLRPWAADKLRWAASQEQMSVADYCRAAALRDIDRVHRAMSSTKNEARANKKKHERTRRKIRARSK